MIMYPILFHQCLAMEAAEKDLSTILESRCENDLGPLQPNHLTQVRALNEIICLTISGTRAPLILLSFLSNIYFSPLFSVLINC